MSGELHPESSHGPQPETHRLNFPLLVTGASVIVILAALFFWPGHSSPPAGNGVPQHLPFGPQEQSYAANLTVENLAMTRAENFLQEQVTTVAGDFLNNGDRPLTNVELTVDFLDDVQQIVLRDTRLLVLAPSPAIAPRERRHFEISFEHIPSLWNMQSPSIRVTGLQFASH